MKIRFILLLSTIIFFSFLTEIKSQTADVTQGCLPLEVSFSGPTGQPTFFWDFMDSGAFATIQNPINTFLNPGTFNVELFDVQGGTLIGTVTIEVFEDPVVTIAADPIGGCFPLNTTLTANLEGNSAIIGTDFQWTFGDGDSGSGPTTSNTYTTEGTFDVGITVTTNLPGCDVGDLFTDFIETTTQPDASFTTSPNPAASCTAPFEVSFTNTSTSSPELTFDWDFGNGQTSTEENPPNVTYTEEGSFDVTFTATNSAGCATVITSNINVGPPTASFSLPDTICFNEAVTINNTSTTGSFSWDFGPNAIPPVSNEANPSVIFTTPGNQTISLNVSAVGGCTSDETLTVFVTDEISPDFNLTTNPVCEDPFQFTLTPDFMDPTATYQWVVNRINEPTDTILNSNEMSPSFEYINPDTTLFSENGDIIISVEYQVTSLQGCIVTGTLIDTLYEPNARFHPDVVDGCAPLEVVFSDSSLSIDPIISYTYNYGDGTQETFSTDADVTHTYTNTGEFDVILITENDQGCIDTSFAITIEVGETLVPDFTATETTVCPGDTVQFTDLTNNPNIDGWHFVAEGGLASHCFQEDELFYNFDNTTGPQDISLIVDFNGCFSETTKEDFITVNGPIAQLDYLVECDDPRNVAFADSSLDATSILWDFGDGTTSTEPDITHLYDTTGNFNVFLTVENDMSGCPASVDSAIVFIKDIQSAFEIDSFICIGTDVMLNGAMSTDVDARCFRGYDWHFSFDRPITTMEEEISKVFGTPGDHTVELVTRDINGCRDTSSQDVWVFSSQPDFTLSQDTICIPSEEITFISTGMSDTTLVSFEWDFGDMGMAMDSITTHTYTQSPFPEGPLAGPLVTTFNVTLSVEDIVGCPGEVTKPITVYEPYTVITTDPSPANICIGSEVAFEASDFVLDGNVSPVEYNWNFGNGMTSTMQSDVAQYDNSGTFVVNLDITETSTGCQSMRPITDTVRVQDFPIADFTTDVDNEDIICFPGDVSFMDNSVTTSPLTVEWDFGNGSSSTIPAPAITYDRGTFTVEYIVSTSFGCQDTTMRDLTVVGPEGDFTVDQNLICFGETVNFTIQDTVNVQSFQWQFGDGNLIDDEGMVSNTYDDTSGVLLAQLVLLLGDCETFAVEPITVQEAIADFTVIDVCDGPIDIVSTSTGVVAPIVNFMYNFGNGLTSNEENPTVTFPNIGPQNVQLIVSNAMGCADTITQQFEIFPLPTPIVEDVGGCEGTDITLAVSNPDNNSVYNYDPMDLVVNGDGQPSVTVNLNQTTEFTITETTVNNCVGSTTATVDIVPAIPEVGDVDQSVCEGDIINVDLPVNPFYSYTWTALDGADTDDLICTDCPNQIITIDETITYQVVITDINGTCDDVIATFTYDVPPNNDVELPNAFSPNNDGSNDNFNFVVGNQTTIITINRFQIFDRFGNLVYNNNTPADGWDGTFNGDLSNSDVYLYNIEFNDGCSTNSIQGDVTLIR